MNKKYLEFVKNNKDLEKYERISFENPLGKNYYVDTFKVLCDIHVRIKNDSKSK